MWPVATAEPLPEQVCSVCGSRSRLIAAQLGVCLDCIRDRPQEALPISDAAHPAAGHRQHAFVFPDLPRTSVRHAEETVAAARAAGLHTVRIGNRHLLSREY